MGSFRSFLAFFRCCGRVQSANDVIQKIKKTIPTQQHTSQPTMVSAAAKYTQESQLKGVKKDRDERSVSVE